MCTSTTPAAAAADGGGVFSWLESGWMGVLSRRSARIYLLSICFPGAPNENDHQEQKWLLQRVSSFRFRFVLWSTRILPLE
jgi:hypothetical protein